MNDNGNSIKPKVWIIVTITVAIIGCLGVLIASFISIIPDLKKANVIIITATTDSYSSNLPTQELISIPQETIIPNTPTLFTPKNTQTPTTEPTDIIMISPTKTNTNKNSVLEIGDTWYQDGIGIKLIEIERGVPGVRFVFSVINDTQSKLFFEINTENILVTDNNGITYYQKYTCKQDRELNAGKTSDFKTYCPGGYDYLVDIDDPTIDYFIVTLTNFGRIEKAVWKVQIPK